MQYRMLDLTDVSTRPDYKWETSISIILNIDQSDEGKDTKKTASSLARELMLLRKWVRILFPLQ